MSQNNGDLDTCLIHSGRLDIIEYKQQVMHDMMSEKQDAIHSELSAIRKLLEGENGIVAQHAVLKSSVARLWKYAAAVTAAIASVIGIGKFF